MNLNRLKGVGKGVGKTVRIVGILLFLVGLSGVSHRAGRMAEKANNAQARIDSIQQSLEQIQQSMKISHDVGAKHEEARVEIRYRTRYLTQIVPEYVTSADDARCVVNAGFVRHFDASAEGVLPGAPTESDRDASDVTLSEIGRVSAENAAVAHELRATVLAWQDWYSQQSSLYAADAQQSERKPRRWFWMTKENPMPSESPSSE